MIESETLSGLLRVEKAKALYCLLNKKSVEKRKRKREETRKKRRVRIGEGTRGDASSHEGSLVTVAIDKRGHP